jgi:hypothetical protein
VRRAPPGAHRARAPRDRQRALHDDPGPRGVRLRAGLGRLAGGAARGDRGAARAADAEGRRRQHRRGARSPATTPARTTRSARTRTSRAPRPVTACRPAATERSTARRAPGHGPSPRSGSRARWGRAPEPVPG